MSKYTRVSDEYYTLRYYHLTGDWRFMRLLGVRVSLKDYPDLDLFASRGWKGSKPLPRVGKGWTVYDALTGCEITPSGLDGDTPEDAIAEIQKLLDKYPGKFNRKDFEKRQEEMIAARGLSPRYKMGV